MNSKQQLLDGLDALNAPGAWKQTSVNEHSATVGEYTLRVRRLGSYSEWKVSHDRYDIEMKWQPQSVLVYAKRDAVEFAKKHVLGHFEEQHAE